MSSIKFSIKANRGTILLLAVFFILTKINAQDEFSYKILEKKTYKINSAVFKDSIYNLEGIVEKGFKVFFYKSKVVKKANQKKIKTGRLRLRIGDRKSRQVFCDNNGIYFYFEKESNNSVCFSWDNSYEGNNLGLTGYAKIFYLAFNSRAIFRLISENLIIDCTTEKGEKIILNLTEAKP